MHWVFSHDLLVVIIQRQNILRFYSAWDLNLLVRMLLVEVSGVRVLFDGGVVCVVLKAQRVLARGFFRVD